MKRELSDREVQQLATILTVPQLFYLQTVLLERTQAVKQILARVAPDIKESRHA